MSVTRDAVLACLKTLNDPVSGKDIVELGLVKALTVDAGAVRFVLEVNPSHAAAYARVHGLMSCEKLFDISDEPQYIHDMYGPTQFAEQTIMARRMVEAGVPFVRVSRAWWDSHGQNFETHLCLLYTSDAADE